MFLFLGLVFLICFGLVLVMFIILHCGDIFLGERWEQSHLNPCKSCGEQSCCPKAPAQRQAVDFLSLLYWDMGLCCLPLVCALLRKGSEVWTGLSFTTLFSVRSQQDTALPLKPFLVISAVAFTQSLQTAASGTSPPEATPTVLHTQSSVCLSSLHCVILK